MAFNFQPGLRVFSGTWGHTVGRGTAGGVHADVLVGVGYEGLCVFDSSQGGCWRVRGCVGVWDYAAG